MKIPNRIIPLIVISQFAGTSLWFASNAVIGDIQAALNIAGEMTSHVTSAVQLGFILGTLVFALLTLADRYSPSKVFFVCALLGAISNLGVYVLANNLIALLLLRVMTGFFLAGIYPVGMKIAADYFDKGLGKALGYLVGALVVGTAFPHLLKNLTQALNWEYVIILTSLCAVLGGLLMLLFVPDGPHRKPSRALDLSASFKVFQHKPFRVAAFGYFGHMWELYTFWAFVPFFLASFSELQGIALNIPLWSFIIIAVGGLSCVGGGYLSQRYGSDRIAFMFLLLSGLCCLIAPFVFTWPRVFFLAFLVFWGIVVIADSPQFSSLVAQRAPKENIGTALTIVNCLGFSITILSIQFFNYLQGSMALREVLFLLAIGPMLGLVHRVFKG